MDPKDKSLSSTVFILDENASYFKLMLSSEGKILSESDLDASELAEGDQISVISHCSADNPNESTVIRIRKMVVEPEGGESE